MNTLYENVYVGSLEEYQNSTIRFSPTMTIIHAAKEPYHRRMLGYTTRGCPREHPEYWIAHTNNRYALNLIDTSGMSPLPFGLLKRMFDEIASIGFPVLIHCNKGESRAPVIGLCFLVTCVPEFLGMELDELVDYALAHYPAFNPGNGMVLYLREYLKWLRLHATEEDSLVNTIRTY